MKDILIQPFQLQECSSHSQPLQAICLNENCSEKWKLLCRQCVLDSHAIHADETKELFGLLKKTQEQVTETVVQNKELQENLGRLFMQNQNHINKLKEKIQFYIDSQNTMQNAFQIIKEQGNSKLKRVELYLNDILKCLSFSGNGEAEINERLDSLRSCMNVLSDLTFSELSRIEDQTQGVQSKFHHINSFLDSAIAESNATQNTFENTSISTHDMKKMKLRNQEDKNIAKISEIFPMIKGKAKKRDIINFVNWDSQAREFKYQKDNKDKGGEHFYVSFSLSLIGLDTLQEKDFTEEFLLSLVERIRIEAPQIHERKNVERRKMESLGKKRKYCRFHPKIDLDLQELNKKLRVESSPFPMTSPLSSTHLNNKKLDQASVSSQTPVSIPLFQLGIPASNPSTYPTNKTQIHQHLTLPINQQQQHQQQQSLQILAQPSQLIQNQQQQQNSSLAQLQQQTLTNIQHQQIQKQQVQQLPPQPSNGLILQSSTLPTVQPHVQQSIFTNQSPSQLMNQQLYQLQQQPKQEQQQQQFATQFLGNTHQQMNVVTIPNPQVNFSATNVATQPYLLAPDMAQSYLQLTPQNQQLFLMLTQQQQQQQQKQQQLQQVISQPIESLFTANRAAFKVESS